MNVNDSILTMQGKFRVQNLFKLAAYLISEVPNDFHMLQFRAYSSNPFMLTEFEYACLPECGTVGCAIGHGPSAGITPELCERWPLYCKRTLWDTNLAVQGTEYGLSSAWQRMWSWCFSSDWVDYDNSAEGAGLRILYLLRHGFIPRAMPVGRWNPDLLPYGDYRGLRSELLAFAAENGYPITEPEEAAGDA